LFVCLTLAILQPVSSFLSQKKSQIFSKTATLYVRTVSQHRQTHPRTHTIQKAPVGGQSPFDGHFLLLLLNAKQQYRRQTKTFLKAQKSQDIFFLGFKTERLQPASSSLSGLHSCHHTSSMAARNS